MPDLFRYSLNLFDTDNFTKILVATGANDGDTSVEIIDLSDENLVCESLTNLPMDAYGAGKALVIAHN